MRWAKVPEWLLDALVATSKSERDGASPTTALGVYVTLATKHADWKTGKARATYDELAAAVGVGWRAAQRAARLLEHVGALEIISRTPSGGQAANDYVVRADRRVNSGTPVGSGVPSESERDVSNDTAVACISAGQGQPALPTVAPLYPVSASLPENEPEAADGWDPFGTPALSLVELPVGEQMELSPQRVPVSDEAQVQRALDEAWTHLGGRRRPVPDVSSARGSGDGSRVPDGGATGGTSERGLGGTDAAAGAGGVNR